MHALLVLILILSGTDKPVKKQNPANTKDQSSQAHLKKPTSSATPSATIQKPEPQADGDHDDDPSSNRAYKVEVEKTPPDFWMRAYVIINLFIAAVAGTSLFLIKHQRDVMQLQLQAMRDQIGEMQKAREQTIEQMRSAGAQTGDLIRQGAAQVAALNYASGVSLETAQAANTSAKAAEGANKIASQQLILTTRPWIMVEMVHVGPVEFDKAGARVNFYIKATNVGHSPALNVNVYCRVINSQSPNIIGVQKELVANAARGLPEGFPWGAVIFPEKTYDHRRQYTVPPLELTQDFIGFNKGTLLLNIVGCLDYQFGSEYHQTFFAYFIRGIDKNGETTNLMNGINAEQIRWFQDNIMGSTAN